MHRQRPSTNVAEVEPETGEWTVDPAFRRGNVDRRPPQQSRPERPKTIKLEDETAEWLLIPAR